MSRLSIGFILMSFLSSFGDTLFLTGLPLYFYKESGGSVLQTTYVSIAITISVLLTRKWIIHFNKKHPLLITAYGEIAMAGIEAIVLVAYLIFKSKWIVLAGVFPLAVTYNFYAPAKFLKLQDYFFKTDVFYLTAWQSAANRFGILTAIFVSGWIVIHWGIEGILIIDGLTFLIFGLMVLWGYRVFPTRTEAAVLPDLPNSVATENIIPPSALAFSLILISVGTLFTSWEVASSIAISSKVSSFGVDKMGAMRAIVGGLGVIVGLLISRYAKQWSFHIWTFSLFILTLGLSVVGAFGNEAIYVLFFFGGILACINLPVERGIYERVKLQGGDDTFFISGQWIYNAALSLCLIPIGYLSDSNTIPALNALQISSLTILVVGLLGGYVIYRHLVGVRS